MTASLPRCTDAQGVSGRTADEGQEGEDDEEGDGQEAEDEDLVAEAGGKAREAALHHAAAADEAMVRGAIRTAAMDARRLAMIESAQHYEAREREMEKTWWRRVFSLEEKLESGETIAKVG